MFKETHGDTKPQFEVFDLKWQSHLISDTAWTSISYGCYGGLWACLVCREITTIHNKDPYIAIRNYDPLYLKSVYQQFNDMRQFIWWRTGDKKSSLYLQFVGEFPYSWVRHNSWGQGWTYFIVFKTNLIFCRVENLRLFRTPIFLRRKNNPHGELLWSPPAVGTLSLRRAVLHWAPLVAPRRWAGRARRARRAQCLGGLDARAATNAGRCFHCWDNFSDFAMEHQQKLERNQHKWGLKPTQKKLKESE